MPRKDGSKHSKQYKNHSKGKKAKYASSKWDALNFGNSLQDLKNYLDKGNNNDPEALKVFLAKGRPYDVYCKIGDVEINLNVVAFNPRDARSKVINMHAINKQLKVLAVCSGGENWTTLV